MPSSPGCFLAHTAFREFATNQIPEEGAQGITLLLGYFLQPFPLDGFDANADGNHAAAPLARPSSP